MQESYGEEKGKNIALSKLISRSNYFEHVDDHLVDAENTFKWKCDVLDDFSEVIQRKEDTQAVYDIVLNISSSHVTTYNMQIENLSKDIDDTKEENVRSELKNGMNVLVEQRKFYNKISEELYNIVLNADVTRDVMMGVIRKIQNEIRDTRDISRKKDIIATQIDSASMPDFSGGSKDIHLN